MMKGRAVLDEAARRVEAAPAAARRRDHFSSSPALDGAFSFSFARCLDILPAHLAARRHVRRSSRLAPPGQAPGEPPPRVVEGPRRPVHSEAHEGRGARRAVGVQGADRQRRGRVRGPRREGLGLLLREARRRPRVVRPGEDAESVRGARTPRTEAPTRRWRGGGAEPALHPARATV